MLHLMGETESGCGQWVESLINQIPSPCSILEALVSAVDESSSSSLSYMSISLSLCVSLSVFDSSSASSSRRILKSP